MNPSYSHMMIIHLFIRWYHIFFQATGKKRRKKEPPPPKKKTFCCADVAAWLPGWINRCFKYRGQGVQRESFCYTKIGSVCFKNQLLTLTKKEVLAIKTSASIYTPTLPAVTGRSMCCLISPHMCRMWAKVALSFPSHLLKTMAKCMWQNYLFQVVAAKNETKTGKKNICGT